MIVFMTPWSNGNTRKRPLNKADNINTGKLVGVKIIKLPINMADMNNAAGWFYR